MLNRIFKLVLLGGIALVITITATSCRKAKDTIGVVIVKDGSGNPIPHARVVLHANPLKQPLYEYNPENYTDRSLDLLVKHNIDTTYSYAGQYSAIFKADWTDNNGRAEFTLPLEMALNISVLKINGNKEYLGAGIINIKKENITIRLVRLLSY